MCVFELTNHNNNNNGVRQCKYDECTSTQHTDTNYTYVRFKHTNNFTSHAKSIEVHTHSNVRACVLHSICVGILY